MNNPWKFLSIFFFGGFFCFAARASNLDAIGATLLRETTTNLDGTGIYVGQAEADDPGSPPGTNTWEINPNAIGVEQPTNLFTYFNGSSPYLFINSTNAYPNLLGFESGHGEHVAANFYGMPSGIATNVAHVDNYAAEAFVEYYINDGHPISDRVVNQSYTEGIYDSSVDQIFDDYAAQNNVLFVTGAGFNGQPVYSPATCYNGIGVGSEIDSPPGPTPDGRCKPDIIAPGFEETSYTTPFVAGAAALLMQAGLRGDGGGDTNSAADIRTVKALLLNGAIKPANWTNYPPEPLDTNYGAGVLNVFNSYEQLAGGKHGYLDSTTVSIGGTHPPTGAAGAVSALNGWDFNTNTSDVLDDAINHYYFEVTNAAGNSTFAATATLVWNRQAGQTNINNLELFLYNCANSNLVASSTSVVDNVQQIFVPGLPQGRYDLQVWKAGGVPDVTIVSSSETYALAWTFVSMPLNIAQAGTNVALTWPVYPAGFTIESATNLVSPVAWSTDGIPIPVVMNSQNCILLGATNANQFFRLQYP